jgi:hypothetical protein
MDTRLPGAFLIAYAGLSAGAALVAIPAVFLAPDLSSDLAHEIARVVLGVLNTLEWCLVIALIIQGLLVRPASIWWTALVVVVALLIVESVWLLPRVANQVQLMLDNGTAAPPNLLSLYFVTEAVKVLVLAAGGVGTMMELLPRPARRRPSRWWRTAKSAVRIS